MFMDELRVRSFSTQIKRNCKINYLTTIITLTFRKLNYALLIGRFLIILRIKKEPFLNMNHS